MKPALMTAGQAGKSIGFCWTPTGGYDCISGIQELHTHQDPLDIASTKHWASVQSHEACRYITKAPEDLDSYLLGKLKSEPSVGTGDDVHIRRRGHTEGAIACKNVCSNCYSQRLPSCVVLMRMVTELIGT